MWVSFVDRVGLSHRYSHPWLPHLSQIPQSFSLSNLKVTGYFDVPIDVSWSLTQSLEIAGKFLEKVIEEEACAYMDGIGLCCKEIQ